MRLSTAELDAMVAEAIVDAYGEHEQLAAFQAVIEDRLALPFTTVVLGIPVTVTALQEQPGSGIAALCAHSALSYTRWNVHDHLLSHQASGC
ncbi:hypothetical protein [Streptomyces sp. NPDC047869]|uniref:hypothetical protein n=1 Tax=Streptomyces sp. NPDC047869 TaxID=3154709 RepID=UPI0034531B5E